MKRSLPTPRSRSVARSIAKSAAKSTIQGTLNLGSMAFNKMFPTVGRLMGRMGGSKTEQDKTQTDTRRLQSSLSSDLSQNSSRLSAMLDNQNSQNQLLGRLLSVYKAMPATMPVIAGGGGGGDLGDLSGLVPGLDRRNARQTRRDARRQAAQQRRAQRQAAQAQRPPATAAQRPPTATSRIPTTPATPPSSRVPTPTAITPATRVPTPTVTPPSPPTTPPSPPRTPTPTAATPATTPSGISRAGTAVRAGARVAVRFLGPLGAILALREGLNLLAQQSNYLSAGKRTSLTRTINSLQSNIDTYKTKLEQLQNEENEQEALKIGQDLEKLLENIRSQRNRISQMAAELDTDLQRENTRRRRSTDFSFTQAVAQLTGEASQLSLPAQTEAVETTLPVPTNVPAPATPEAGPVLPIPPSISTPLAPPEAVPVSAPPAPPPVAIAVAAPTLPALSMPPPVATPTAAPALPALSIPPAPPIAPPAATAVPTTTPAQLPVAVQIEGSTLTYDFEKVTFEADLIKFDGPSNLLQAAAPATSISQPSVSMAMQPAQITRNLPTAVGAAGSGSGVMPGGAGSIPAQITRNPPTPVGAPGSGSGVMPGGAMAQPAGGTASRGSPSAAMQFFISKGWTPAQAAGFAANLQVESDFDPNAVGDNGRAYGIAQWHPPRQDAFRAWSGRDIRGSTFEQQLEFINFELTQGTERRAGTMIRQATTPEQAAALVDQYYERSSGHARARRMQLAASYATGSTAIAGQQQAAPSSGPAMAQASTARVATDRQQVATTQRMAAGFNQQVAQQQSRQATQQTAPAPRTGGEVPLKIRILSTFEQLARA